MILREIRLAHVRSYELFSAELSPETTLVLGPNGTGKTTLLEAIGYLTMGTSFRGRDREMIAHDTTRADLALELTNGAKRSATLQLTPDDKVKKTFKVADKTSARLPARARIPTVLFDPDELRLLSSSPERRRRFFDSLLARLYPSYATILARYQRTVLQRNELLKQYREATSRPTGFRGRSDLSGFNPDTSGGTESLLRSLDDQLFVWDIKFAELAREITRQRREFVMTTSARLSEHYSRLAGTEHHVQSSYHSSISPDNYQQTLLHRLTSERLADSDRGFTSVGPHRDDILIHLDGHPVGETASRGELRSIMLAYKLLEVELQHELTDTMPLILLDDVFSELDTSREQALLTALSGHQTIITATDIRNIAALTDNVLSIELT